MTPITQKRYLDMRTNKFVSPGFSLVKCTAFDPIPIGSLFAVQIHACNGRNFELDSSGNVPAANQASLGDYTGIPLFCVKTRAQWKDATDTGDFVASVNGAYAPLTTLASGRIGVCGVIPIGTDFGGDCLAQVQLLDASANPRALPSVPAPVLLEQPIAIGDEASGPTPTVTYSGVATITSGASSVAVTVTGLTVATGVLSSLTQQSTGADLTQFWGVITANTLTINAAGGAPAEGYKVYWKLDSL